MANNKINYKEVCIVTQCPFCGHYSETYVNNADYLDYDLGLALVQEAFPYLTPNEREMIITGICPPCWANNFS